MSPLSSLFHALGPHMSLQDGKPLSFPDPSLKACPRCDIGQGKIVPNNKRSVVDELHYKLDPLIYHVIQG